MKCPAWLEPHGKEVWKKYAKRVKPDQEDLLMMLCVAFVAHRKAAMDLQVHGVNLETSTGGLKPNSGATQTINSSTSNILRLLKALGLTDEVDPAAVLREIMGADE